MPSRARSNCPLVAEPAQRAKANATTAPLKAEFPRGVSEPALRALAARGLLTLEHLGTVTERELLAMHGMGPKAVRILRDAMQLRGLTFRQ